MAKSTRAALTRVAATVTARYYQSSGATDGFYLDGRLSGRREHRAADITLDREDRGFFYSVFAHLAGGSPDEAAQGRVRKALDRILAEVRQPGHNIDSGINELAECAVSVAGRITLQHDGVRQPYFAGIMIKDSELAAVTMGSGCAYLYRGDVLYPLTADDVELEAINCDGKPVTGLDVYCAGVAGTVRYSNIAQLQLDDCLILCNKEIMDALGQREVLRMLYEAEDQSDAAGMIITAASAKLPGVPLQFLIGFVESISAADRTGRINFGRQLTETAAATTGSAARGNAGAAPTAGETGYPAGGQFDETAADTSAEDEYQMPAARSKGDSGVGRAGGRQSEGRIFDEDDYVDDEGSGRGRRIAFYVIIAIICLGCLFAIFNLLFGDRGNTGKTTAPTTSILATTTGKTTTAASSGTTAGTTAAATSATTVTGQTQIHTVVSGDTLSGIANKYYGSSAAKYIDLIKQANNMTSDNLQIGQKLTIPAKP